MRARRWRSYYYLSTVSAKGAAFIGSLGQRSRNSGNLKTAALKARVIQA